MRIGIAGKIELENVVIEGLKIADWQDVRLEVHSGEVNDEAYVRLVLSGLAPGLYPQQREMAEIYMCEGGKIRVVKPIYRLHHDHDDQANYHEVRGVSNNPNGRSGGWKYEDAVSDEPLSVIPLIVDD